MESKYYTPTIEEFHVGFECEWRRLEEDWHGGKINSSIELYDAAIEYEAGENQTYEYRVKYLDKEDIESFGFKCEEENEDSSYYKFVKPSYNSSNIVLCYYIWHTGNADLSEIDEHRKIRIYRTDGTPITLRANAIDTELPIDRDMLSLSTIKNKSELNILLKQLGIE